MRQATISFRVLTLLLCLFVSSSLRYHLFLDAVDTRREYVGHGQAHKDFESLYLAAKDISAGGETKVDGLPPVMLHALAERLGQQLPSTQTYRAGCVSSTEQMIGPGGRGTYSMLLPPQTDGICITPSLSSFMDSTEGGDAEDNIKFKASMEWRDQSIEEETRWERLPPVEDVFDTIFARKNGKARVAREEDPQLNFWMLSFVNWFHDDNFRTLPDTDGAFTWSDRGSLHMTHLYGHTEYRQAALRTMAGDGKMKTSSRLGWDYYPPLLMDVQADFPDFDMWTSQRGSKHKSTSAGQTSEQADENMPYYFAIGDPRFNLHLGHILWTSVGLYLHNTACVILQREDPGLTDEDIFQRARVIVFHIIQKIRLQDFVMDSISSTRDHIRIPYDPKLLREEFAHHFAYSGGNQPNFLEFNHLYQAWHALIPNGLVLNEDVNDDGEKDILPIRKTLWAPKLMTTNFTIGEMATSFASTPLTLYSPHNFPVFLRGVTEAALKDERAQRMAPYNSYRELIGLDPITSFEQFAVDDPQKMAELYNNDVDSVDFIAGILADSNPHLPGNFFGDVQLVLVALFALQDLANNPLILDPVMSSSDYLTEGGLKFVQDFEFRDFLEELTGESHPCPFQTPGSPCVGGYESFTRPEDVGAQFMDPARVRSFIGVDLTEWYFYENGYMRLAYFSALVSMALIPALYLLAFVVFGYRWPDKTTVSRGKQGDHSLSSTADDTSGHTLNNSSELSMRPTQGVKKSRRRSSFNDQYSMNRSTIPPARNNSSASIPLRVSWCCLLVNTILSLAFVGPTTTVWLDFMTNPYWIQTFADSAHIVPSVVYSAVAVHFAVEIVFRLAQSRGLSSSSMMIQITIHHLGSLIAGALLIASSDVAVFKMVYTALTGWTWEWPMFLCFFVSRTYDAQTRDGKNLSDGTFYTFYRLFVFYAMPIMVVIYFATRVIEVVYMGMIIAAVVDRNAATPTVKGVIAIMAVAITLQFYSGYILAVFCSRRRNRIVALEASANATGTPFDAPDASDSSDIERDDISPTTPSACSSSLSSSRRIAADKRWDSNPISAVPDLDESESSYNEDGEDGGDDNDEDEDGGHDDNDDDGSTCTLEA
mmetsp:Transcript_4577/g.11645  ORF Transcript_4577/g.11645 Transcript_4577/m.11645 type:complete len:1105 (+) Transcript_4577:142-3456(+)